MELQAFAKVIAVATRQLLPMLSYLFPSLFPHAATSATYKSVDCFTCYFSFLVFAPWPLLSDTTASCAAAYSWLIVNI